MNAPDEQVQYDRAYRSAMKMIDQEWIAAGKTQEELDQEKQLIELFDRLLACGRSR